MLLKLSFSRSTGNILNKIPPSIYFVANCAQPSKMASEFLRSRYELYKEDTARVSTWLASTAKKHGYKEELVARSNELSSSGIGRLKGKARKAAKSQVKQGSSTAKVKSKNFW